MAARRHISKHIRCLPWAILVEAVFILAVAFHKHRDGMIVAKGVSHIVAGAYRACRAGLYYVECRRKFRDASVGACHLYGIQPGLYRFICSLTIASHKFSV